MALIDFIQERRTVYLDGRRFCVRAPTLATVLLAETLFPEQILACWRMAQDNPEAWAAEPIAVGLAVADVTADPGLARVLETCVDGDSPPLTWPVAQLVREVLEIVQDLPALANSLQVGEAAVEQDGGARRSADDTLMALAERFGCAPNDITEWPYESFARTLDLLSGVEDDDSAAALKPAFPLVDYHVIVPEA